MSKPPNDNQSCLCEGEQLDSGQTSKGATKALTQDKPCGGKDIAKLP
jgi:hypothetical protein